MNLNDLPEGYLRKTVGDIRVEMKEKKQPIAGGMVKQWFLEYKLCRVSFKLRMVNLWPWGTEGRGFYCYANSSLWDVLKTLQVSFDYIIIDNDAGMAQLNRRVDR